MNARALFVAMVAISVWIAVIETRPTPTELSATTRHLAAVTGVPPGPPGVVPKRRVRNPAVAGGRATRTPLAVGTPMASAKSIQADPFQYWTPIASSAPSSSE